ncbi:hydrolase [Tersicoccus solisilvae]|uniref:Hydrolase n=1 Tax=Tersicoccus solisilvae TaxID=1882339 RepID=A0ABQ1P045_9MICC|nr:zinc-dependent metalloprotease [Tersicoccus solisilvae]GGC87813.1 hydrolase [Tersicoccus solisilvae]
MSSQHGNDDDTPQDPLSEMLSKLLGGNLEGFDPAELARAAGMPSDPNTLAMMFQQVQAMMSASGDSPVNWQLAHESARRGAAARTDPSVSASQRRDVEEALRVAELWLDPVTDFPGTGLTGRAWSRAEWVEATMGTWKQMTEPVANSIATALTQAMTEQMPEEMAGMMGGAGSMIRNLGGALFGMQLGHAVGELAGDVVSASEIGIPLAEGTMALLPANVAAFGEGLDLDESQVRLYLAVREAAHARLFVHVPWLRSHVLGIIGSYARGIHIDTARIEDAARQIDPSNPESVQEALSGGMFTPERTPEQEAALARLETALALIEGWVDEATAAATTNLPAAAALREVVRRRRATGGPAEQAFASLVGLELRPRRLRDAAALWAALTEERGAEGRDAVWAHPDLLPTPEDLDHPADFTARSQQRAAADADVDAALEKLLAGGFDEKPATAEDAVATDEDELPGQESLFDVDPDAAAGTDPGDAPAAPADDPSDEPGAGPDADSDGGPERPRG